jgi:hypothetical protein
VDTFCIQVIIYPLFQRTSAKIKWLVLANDTSVCVCVLACTSALLCVCVCACVIHAYFNGLCPSSAQNSQHTVRIEVTRAVCFKTHKRHTSCFSKELDEPDSRLCHRFRIAIGKFCDTRDSGWYLQHLILAQLQLMVGKKCQV